MTKNNTTLLISSRVKIMSKYINFVCVKNVKNCKQWLFNVCMNWKTGGNILMPVNIFQVGKVDVKNSTSEN